MKPRFFDLAKRLADHSEHHQHKIGAVIVQGNRILGVGFNRLKTHTKSNHSHRSMHAELSAILNSKQESFKKASIYVYRENKAGMLAQSKPCSFCQVLLKTVGIQDVFYTTEGSYEYTKLGKAK